MDKDTPAANDGRYEYADKYKEVLTHQHYYSDEKGFISVWAHNLFHLSKMLHASAMKHMKIQSKREEVLFLGCAYQGEAGELGNVLKKIARDGETPELMEKLGSEVADNYLYLHHIVDLFKINPQDAMCAKTSELYNERQPDWAVRAILACGGEIHEDQDAS